MPVPAPIPGPAGAAGAAGATGPAGPAPAGTGLVSVTAGVLDTPLTLAAGDIVVGGALGVPSVLSAGTNGYILRVSGGSPVWREISAAGLAANRPTAIAGREGQEYWSTDAAAGLELSRCVHKGDGNYAWEVVAYGVTATGVALAQATDSGAARTALGLGTPTTLAAQARAEAQRRRGPLAMRFPTSSDYVSTANTTGTTTPSLGLSTSGVIVVYSSQAGSYSSSYILHSGVNATRGFFLAVSSATGGDDLLIRSMSSSGNVDAWITGFVSTVGWHAVAFSIPANGLTVRYSLDGAAVATATPGTTPWPFTSRLAADAVTIGSDAAGTGCGVPLAYIALWSSVLSDADLVTLSSSPSAGAPTLPSTPAWEWAAAAHAGVRDVSLGAYRYSSTGTPAVWMP